MSTAFILLCGGSASRWDNHLGVPKHMAPVGGEPLISRTIRQVKARLGISPMVVARDERIVNLVGSDHCLTEYGTECVCAGALSTKPYWDDRTFLMFGDVYYSRETIEQFLSVSGLRVFWSDTQMIGYHWDNDQDRQRVEAALRATVELQKHAISPDSQQFMGYLNYSFHLIQGLPIVENPVSLSNNRHRKDSPLIVEACGLCMDFDYPREHDYFLKHYKPDGG